MVTKRAPRRRNASAEPRTTHRRRGETRKNSLVRLGIIARSRRYVPRGFESVYAHLTFVLATTNSPAIVDLSANFLGTASEILPPRYVPREDTLDT